MAALMRELGDLAVAAAPAGTLILAAWLAARDRARERDVRQLRSAVGAERRSARRRRLAWPRRRRKIPSDR